MRRGDLFTVPEEKVLATLDEPFQTTFRICAIAANDMLGALFDGPDAIMNVEDGWRSDEAQDKLYEIGRERIGDTLDWRRARDVRGKLLDRVTDARGGYSPHNYRRGCHIVLRHVDRNAKGQREWLPASDKRWLMLRDIVKANGLRSGADFQNIFDPAHVESVDWRLLAEKRGHFGLKINERMHKWRPSSRS